MPSNRLQRFDVLSHAEDSETIRERPIREIAMMRALSSVVFVLMLAFISPALAAADPEHRVERVAFRDGHASVKGRIKGYAYVDYVFPAGAGESIKIHFDGDKRYSNYFILTAPGATEAMFDGTSAGDDYQGVATIAGDYTARVFMMRNDARRKRIANYRMNIAVGATSATNEKGPDFADGLTGGPDFWEVTGVASNDTLHLRDAPAPDGKIVASVGNREALKNGGCQNTQGQRWCRVTTKGGAQGWANGKYLREGAGW